MSERAPSRRRHLQLVYSCAAFPLAGSTHEDRTEVLSWALHQLPPDNLTEETVRRRRALFDLAMIESDHHAAKAAAAD